MSVIIAATDFSPTANSAVDYACQMAQAYGASLHIVHSFVIPVTFGDTPMPLMPVDDGREIAEESMGELINQLHQSYPGVIIEPVITYGDITDSLEDYSEKQNPWLIVVGNSSTSDTQFWLGSNLISELRDLPQTVLAVPPGTKFNPPKNICLACDFKQVGKTFPAAEIIALAEQTKAQLHILNVDHDNKNFGTEMPLNAEVIHNYLKDAAPQYHYIESKDIEEGISNFVTEKGMDWLVVIPHKHSFFDSLFKKSHTSAIVKMSHIPLVALHEHRPASE